MTRGIPGEECLGEGSNHMTSDMKGRAPKLQDQQYARGKKVTRGKISSYNTCLFICLFFTILPAARHLVTFCTWPIIPALLMSNCILCQCYSYN